MVKKIIKKILPPSLILLYHRALAACATGYYGAPSKKMIVIGVTGTKGKTSTANFIWAALSAGGHRTGVLTTANIRIGESEVLNPYHMTMPGRMRVQKYLRAMLDAECQYAVVETTSEGIKQFRHGGVEYDVSIFTNLSLEHIEAHGSFEEYKKTKGKMFVALTRYPNKILNGKKIDKVIIANRDSEHASYFLDFPADKKITFSVRGNADTVARDVVTSPTGTDFIIADKKFHVNIVGAFNVANALPAIIIARREGVSDEKIQEGFLRLARIPGRMEFIQEGQNFSVIVDYAHEPASMRQLLDTVHTIKKPDAKIILLFGATGGGRDAAKRSVMGEFAAREADYVILSNDDPFDDNPQALLESVAVGAIRAGAERDKNLFIIEDRREGIRKALSLAREHDFVLLAGKGAEQLLMMRGGGVPWDDRVVAREELKKLNSYEL